jgi:subfamily B ATP-binding cassette protein MsbA
MAIYTKGGASRMAVIKRMIVEIILPYWINIAFSIGLMIVIASTNSFQALLIQPAVDQTLFNVGDQGGNFLYQIPILIFVVTLSKGIATYYQQVISSTTIVKMTNDLRVRLYEKYIKSDMEFYNNSSSANMMSSMYNDVQGMMGGINLLISGIFKNFFSVIFLFAVMLYQNPMLTLVSLVGLPLAIYPIYIVYRKVDKYMYKSQEQLANFTVLMDDSLRSAKVVKSYNAEEYEIGRMRKTLNGLFNSMWRIARVSNITGPLNEALIGIGTAAVLFYGGSLVVGGDATPGSFFSFFTALMMAYKPMKAVGGLNIQLQMCLVCARRVFEIMDAKPKIVDKPNAIALANVNGDIKFEDVHFSYIKDKKALNGINLHIEAGKTYAFVGHSGGGKSTIMSLLLRFYDPDSGSIKVEGHDIRDVTMNSLRHHISYVGQDVQLFDDTIKENIKYSNREATDEDIINAAKMAEAHDFIMECSSQYETQMGQNGQKFSGGQRQRISIARAILRNTPILLLDEATSALDPISEKQVQIAIAHLMQGKTTLVIAHRLSTVMNADKIFVINHGKIVEEGTHNELLAKNGEYAILYSKQFQV